MNWSPLNVLVEMVFGAVLLFGLGALVYAAQRHNTRLTRAIEVALLSWVGFYLAAVLIVSLTSKEIVLPRGTAKQFCGFYIDCHMSVAIGSVSTAPTLGAGAAAQQAHGTFYLLTVRVANDAQRETLALHRPGVWMVDDSGRRFAPISTAAFDGGAASLSQPLPAGTAYPTVLVFDLPNDVTRPRLLVTEMDGVWPDRLFEMLLIGDEDSLLHPKTTLAVSDESPKPIMSAFLLPRARLPTFRRRAS